MHGPIIAQIPAKVNAGQAGYTRKSSDRNTTAQAAPATGSSPLPRQARISAAAKPSHADQTLPVRLVSALSVALYGMFIAVIVPPARQNRVIAVLIVLSMALSWLFSAVELFRFMSSGAQVIVLTIAISAFAAWRFPIREEVSE